MSGRIRTVKPEWLEDEKIGATSDSARVMSVALIVLADDYGNGRAHPSFLASHVWVYGDPHETLMKVSGALRELVVSGFATIYNVGGQKYFHIRNWDKHQKVQHPGSPRVPGPFCDSGDSHETLMKVSGESHETLMKVSGESHESLTPDLRSPITDLRSTIGECEGAFASLAPATAAPVAPPPPTDFKLEPVEGKKTSRAPRAKAVEATLPPGWQPKDRHYSLGADRGFSEARVQSEAEAFCANAVAHGKRFASWDAAFAMWIMKAAQWAAERASR